MRRERERERERGMYNKSFDELFDSIRFDSIRCDAIYMSILHRVPFFDHSRDDDNNNDEQV